jgi:glycerol-3-phosphate dehydrogenase (NAD(P)+)
VSKTIFKEISMQIAILGAGAWGTALAVSFSQNHRVALYSRNNAQAQSMRAVGANLRYLPEVGLPTSMMVTNVLQSALDGAQLVVVATSTAGLAPTLQAIAIHPAALQTLWVCKGFDPQTQSLPHVIAAAHLPESAKFGALSGPSFALEVGRGLPAALTCAAHDANFAHQMATSLSGQMLRVYSSTDLVGVELGGALKNVMAIAAGIGDGLELGDNARAALITRGLREMVRLGTAMGGKPETFMGLTGLGDLVLTATGGLSRNRKVGMQLAKGKKLNQILADLGHVAEGVYSARTALALAAQYHVEMPITQAVNRVLFEDANPREAVNGLFARDTKPE